jgi:putative DNA primase/helicase
LGDYLLNFSGEISTRLTSDWFKKLASREKVSARYPYGRPFEISNYARLAFSCNELPEAEDTSEGFYRRFLIIEFDQYIRKEERDINLARKIISEELPGVMNWILRGLKRLTENNRFSPCKSADRKLEWYRRHSNPVVTFLESDDFKCLPDEVMANDLYSEYMQFCEREGYNTVGPKTFSFKIRNCGLRRERKSEGIYYLKQ